MKAFLTILLLCFGVNALAQNALTVSVNKPAEVKPGSHFTVFIMAKGNIPEKLTPVLDLPAGWSKLVEKINPLADGSQTMLYTIACPNTTSANTYKIPFRLDNATLTVHRGSFDITVPKIRNLVVDAYNIPEYVSEGDSLGVSFIVQNLGNSVERIKVASSANLVGTKDSIDILPNSSYTIIGKQYITKTGLNDASRSSDIKIYKSGEKTPLIKTVVVPVVTLTPKEKDPYLRYPLELGVWNNYYNQNAIGTGALQFDVRANSFIDWKQNHRLGIIAHGPNRFYLPNIGSFDQYQLTYKYKLKLNVEIGDYSLRFNNLMEQGRFGRGGRVDYDGKKSGFTAFYNMPRFYNDQKQTYGAAFRIIPSKNITLSVNYLNKTIPVKSILKPVNFIGVSSVIKTSNFDMNTEYAASMVNDGYDLGIYNMASYRFSRLSLNSNFIKSGADFYGFVRDSWLSIQGLSYRLSKKGTLTYTNNISRLNPSFDVIELKTSPYTNSNLLNYIYSFNPQNRLMLGLNQQNKEDRSSQKLFHFNEYFGMASISTMAERFGLYAETRYGEAKNLLLADAEAKYKLSVSSNIQPQVRILPWLWVGGLAEYQKTSKFSLDNAQQKFFFYGGTLRFDAGQKFYGGIQYRNNYALDAFTEKLDFLNANLTLDLKHHQLSLNGGQSYIPNFLQIDPKSNLFFVLKYTLRLFTPIAKDRKIGSIMGQLVGQNASINKSGIIVNLNNRKYKTDSSGKFYFLNLYPDKYSLTINKTDLQKGVIANFKMPYIIDLKADSSKSIKIELVTTGSIKGKISFQKEGTNSLDVLKKPYTLVRIENEAGESKLTDLNAKDEFYFSEIKTGKWAIKIWTPGQEDKFMVYTDFENLIVNADTDYLVNSVIKLKERKIIFSQKNFDLNSKQLKKPNPKP